MASLAEGKLIDNEPAPVNAGGIPNIPIINGTVPVSYNFRIQKTSENLFNQDYICTTVLKAFGVYSLY